MAATLKDLYDAFDAGASKTILLRLIEELDRTHIPVPPELRQDVVEMANLGDEEGE